MRFGWTLRARVIALAVGTAALVVVLAGIPIALLLRDAAYADAEHDATYAAQSTADYMSTGRYDDTILKAYLARLNQRGSTPVTVVMPDGDVLGARLDAAALGTVDRHTGPPLRADHDADNLGQVSSAVTLRLDDARLVQVTCDAGQGVAHVVALVTDASVASTVKTRYVAVAGAGALLIALAWIAADLTGRRLVRPLQRAADTAVALSAGDLSARAPVEGPEEVARVAIELNALADRIDELLIQEREAAADLSHRLRTPLTAVRLAVEALAPEARRELETQVANLERALTQVIRAARRPVREGLHPRCDAAEVMRDRADFWRPLAEDQDRHVSVELPEEAMWVRIAAEDLAAALDALLENVIAHTPEGTHFTLSLTPLADGATIDVLDEGPGIPDSALQRGRSDRGSSGLGLDIARSAAEAAGGSLELLHDPQRHGVRLHLRADPQQALTNP